MARWVKNVCPGCGEVKTRLYEHHLHDKRLAENTSYPGFKLNCRKCGKPFIIEDAPELSMFSDFYEAIEKMKIPKLSWPEQCGIQQELLNIHRKVRYDLKPSGKGKKAREILKTAPGFLSGGWWLDHVDFDGDTLISEPYNLGVPALKSLIAFCEQHNLELTISGASWWYPGNTLRIELKRKEAR